MDGPPATLDAGASNAAGTPGAARRQRVRRWLLAAIAFVYVVSVPWYRQPDADPPLWFGLPSWVTVALLCYAAAAVLNAFAWLWTPIDDEQVIDLGPGAATDAAGPSAGRGSDGPS